MSNTLLATKLYIPQSRPNLVTRHRLSLKLDEVMHPGQRLLLVSAPAGYGKTTLIAKWLHDHPQPTAATWISLDEGDNDHTRFLTYLIAALRTIQPGAGETALVMLQSPQLPALEVALISLLNDIAAFPGSCLIVLDDYHVIKAQPVHDAVSFLVEHLPPQIHLVIATRADPPLPLARLRARGQLTEIRLEDLRFTSEETLVLLNQAMGLDISAGDIAALQSRTEGWIAGLHMAAITMRDRTDRSDFIHSFTGSTRYILDYLVEEVLQLQPAFIQEFLLHTSILDRLCDSLCNAVANIRYPISDQSAGPPDVGHAQHILEFIERANLFIIPLDDKQHWYRYHQLFADLLRHRLQQLQPERVPVLHHRASEWYEQHGFIPEAIEHALKSKDFARAAGLIETMTEATLMRSEIATLHGWMEALPGEFLHTRPLLCAYHAWELLLSGHSLSEAEAFLRRAVESDTTGIAFGAIMAFRALIATYQGDTHTSIQMARQALEKLPEGSLFLRSVVAGSLSLNYFLRGDVEPAQRTLEEAARISHKAGNLMNEVLAVSHQGDMFYIQGQLHEAKACYEQAIDLATDTRGQHLPIAGIPLSGLGNLFREWDDLDQAVQYLQAGIELIKNWGQLGAINGYTALARTYQALGDIQGVNEAMQAAKQAATDLDVLRLGDGIIAGHQATLCVWQGNINAATRWIEERGYQEASIVPDALIKRVTDSPTPLLLAFEYMTLAGVRLAQQKPDQALAVLKPLSRVVEDAGWNGTLINVLALQAMAVRALGDEPEAIRVLDRALTLAEPEGFVRVFVDEGEPMLSLIADFRSLLHNRLSTEVDARKNRLLAYTTRLLSAFGIPPAAVRSDQPSLTSQQPTVAGSLIEPLSNREIQVLRLLSAGLSSTEIAEKLIISPHTVRSHMKSIYGKLDIHSRYEAVERARAMGLI